MDTTRLMNIVLFLLLSYSLQLVCCDYLFDGSMSEGRYQVKSLYDLDPVYILASFFLFRAYLSTSPMFRNRWIPRVLDALLCLYLALRFSSNNYSNSGKGIDGSLLKHYYDFFKKAQVKAKKQGSGLPFVPQLYYFFGEALVIGILYHFTTNLMTTLTDKTSNGNTDNGLFSLFSVKSWSKMVMNGMYGLVKDLPMVVAQIEKEQDKLEADLEKDLKTRSRAIVLIPGMESNGRSSTGSSTSRSNGKEGRKARSKSPTRGRGGSSTYTSTSDSSSNGGNDTILNQLPAEGVSAASILSLMQQETVKENVIWAEGKVSGAVYHGEEGHMDLLNRAFSMYSISNPLHPDIWPSGMKFESEVIAMTASLMYSGDASSAGSASANTSTSSGNGGSKYGLHSSTEVCGCTTSGGTESIILAIKSHRDYFRDKYGITSPELIACTSAHAAVNKACDLMDIKLIQVPMKADNSSSNKEGGKVIDDAEFMLDPASVTPLLGPNTILIYASAPSFPQGVIDPIRALSNIAASYGVGLHVDCCLGGFILPFARHIAKQAKAGKNDSSSRYSDELIQKCSDIPAYDFDLEGVTSMSVDTHKYGYTLKGTSVVLYKNKKLRQYQYFCYSDWSGGMYTTPTIAGSRSGGLIAQCWASMVTMGYTGYVKHTADILQTVIDIKTALRGMDEIVLLGHAPVMIVCFGADPGSGINTYSIADFMSKRGWSLNVLQNPACVHLCVTVRHVGREQVFISDLKESVAACQDALARGEKLGGKAAIYGMASGMPAGPIEELLKLYNDVVLKT